MGREDSDNHRKNYPYDTEVGFTCQVLVQGLASQWMYITYKMTLLSKPHFADEQSVEQRSSNQKNSSGHSLAKYLFLFGSGAHPACSGLTLGSVHKGTCKGVNPGWLSAKQTFTHCTISLAPRRSKPRKHSLWNPYFWFQSLGLGDNLRETYWITQGQCKTEGTPFKQIHITDI